MTQPPSHPAPPINRDLAFLYEGFNRGELLVQACGDCGRLRHPPSPACLECGSMRWTPKAMSGRGAVHSYTVHHHPPIPPWPLPHTVVLVDMEEGFRFVAAMPGAEGGTAAIGAPVHIVFVEVEPGYRLPQFVAGTSS